MVACLFAELARQIIATLGEVTSNGWSRVVRIAVTLRPFGFLRKSGGLERESLQYSLNSGLGICPESCQWLAD